MIEIKEEFDYDGSDESFAELISWVNRNLNIVHFDILIYADKGRLKPGKAVIYINNVIDVKNIVL